MICIRSSVDKTLLHFLLCAISYLSPEELVYILQYKPINLNTLQPPFLFFFQIQMQQFNMARALDSGQSGMVVPSTVLDKLTSRQKAAVTKMTFSVYRDPKLFNVCCYTTKFAKVKDMFLYSYMLYSFYIAKL